MRGTLAPRGCSLFSWTERPAGPFPPLSPALAQRTCQHTQRWSPHCPAPHSPPAWEASHRVPERERDVNTEWEHAADLRRRRESRHSLRQAALIYPALTLQGKRAQAAHSCRRMHWRRAWTCWSGKAELGLGAELSHAHPRFPPSLDSATGSPAATPGLFVYKRITSAPPSLPYLWTRLLDSFPAPFCSEPACVTMVRYSDWLESAVTLQLRHFLFVAL